MIYVRYALLVISPQQRDGNPWECPAKVDALPGVGDGVELWAGGPRRKVVSRTWCGDNGIELELESWGHSGEPEWEKRLRRIGRWVPR